MLWVAYKIGVDEKLLYIARGYCAKTVEHLMIDDRSKKAVAATIAYGKGEITKAQLKIAADDAYAAYASVTYTAYADAVYTTYAASATYTAYADAADAAAAAASAAGIHAYEDMYKKNQKQTADICRKYLTDAVFAIIEKRP